MSRLAWQISLTSAWQLALLGYSYTSPGTRLLNDWLFLGLLVVSSLALAWLAYRAFQAERPGLGMLATVLASPGLLVALAVFTALRCRR
jgi:hypothetical protein